MRVATYNCLHGGSKHRNGHLERLIEAFDADIVLLQEAHSHEQLNLHADAATDARFFWQPVPRYRWGSGVLVRRHRAAPLHVAGFEGWVIGVEIARDRPLRVFSVHCPAGKKGYIRSMHDVLDAIAPLRGDMDLILGGDFNVVTGYRGADEPVKMSRGERELLDRLASEFDLVASWQLAHPGVPLAQTLRWSADRVAPYHCDGIFIPRTWQHMLSSCEILTGAEWERLSDHNPVVAELRRESHLT